MAIKSSDFLAEIEQRSIQFSWSTKFPDRPNFTGTIFCGDFMTGNTWSKSRWANHSDESHSIPFASVICFKRIVWTIDTRNSFMLERVRMFILILYWSFHRMGVVVFSFTLFCCYINNCNQESRFILKESNFIVLQLHSSFCSCFLFHTHLCRFVCALCNHRLCEIKKCRCIIHRIKIFLCVCQKNLPLYQLI